MDVKNEHNNRTAVVFIYSDDTVRSPYLNDFIFMLFITFYIICYKVKVAHLKRNALLVLVALRVSV